VYVRAYLECSRLAQHVGRSADLERASLGDVVSGYFYFSGEWRVKHVTESETVPGKASGEGLAAPRKSPYFATLSCHERASSYTVILPHQR
jgi:hypothetical protein